jgi:D-amino peptidase
MRVLISADMEGTTGVTGWTDVQPGQPPYERFRRLLTADVNAAVQGAFEGGATEVIVNEAHDGMRNILIEELDERAEIIIGLFKPLVMMHGVDECDLVFFTGYHARAGDAGVLAHTLCGEYASVELNGAAASEARLNAALAGEVGVPVGLVTGDDVICSEAEKLFPGVKTAVVKYAIDNFSARCLGIKAAGDRIREAARSAVAEHEVLQPYRVGHRTQSVRHSENLRKREPWQASPVSSARVRLSSALPARTSVTCTRCSKRSRISRARCGSAEVRLPAVIERGRLVLAEAGRHRGRIL